MPRFLVSDRSEIWSRLPHSPLCRSEVEIVLVRDRQDLARRAIQERFDAVVVEAGTDEASVVERELGSVGLRGLAAPRLVAWTPCAGAEEVAHRLGLECRRRTRSRRPLRVEASGSVPFRARAKDASPEGLFLLGAPDLPEGTRLAATLRLAGARRPARATLLVVRRVSEPEDSYRMSGLGVRLEPDTPEDRQTLERWLGERPLERR